MVVGSSTMRNSLLLVSMFGAMDRRAGVSTTSPPRRVTRPSWSSP